MLSGREHPPALKLPVLVLLQQHRPHQARDRGLVREDASPPSVAFDLLIDALEQVGAPDFFQWGSGKWRNAPTSSLASSISSAALKTLGQ